MLCRKPFVKAGAAYPCGQCMPCRVNRRNMWSHRLMLEAFCHVDKAFVTLTYDDDHLIYDWRTRAPILWKEDVQNFLKRLRFKLEPMKLRFYAVGEYGDKRDRPHYHLMLYGYPACGRGSTRGENCCAACDMLRSVWGKGNVFSGYVSKQSAAYVAAYTVKKMTSVDDPRLRGRTPEFCTMSLRPGIGAEAMWDVASSVLAHDIWPDVPLVLTYGRQSKPLGRYLRRRLRKLTGRLEDAPENVQKTLEMRIMYEDWWNSTKGKSYSAIEPFSAYLSRMDDGKVAAIEAKKRLFIQRRSL